MLTPAHDRAATTRDARPLQAFVDPHPCLVSSQGGRVGAGAAQRGDGDEGAGRHGPPRVEDGMDMQRPESTAEARTRRLLIGQGHTPTWAVDGSYTCTACGGRGWIDRRGVLITDSPRSPLQGRCPRMAAA